MARPLSNLRLFVAAYPPGEIAAAWLEQLRSMDLPQYRLVPVEQIHLTLLFIGDTPVSRLDAVVESVQRSCAGVGPFELHPHSFIALPNEPPRQPSRLIAVETDAPAPLLEIQRRLALRLARASRKRADKPFRPHLTLCRFLSPTPVTLHDAAVPTQPFTITVEQVKLMRSTLSAFGAQHHEVESFALT